jgi:dUTP pyrophosphatase
MEKIPLMWIKFNESAIIPKRGTNHSAGYDLYADGDYDIKHHNYILPRAAGIADANRNDNGKSQPVVNPHIQLIKTSIGVIIPKGYYGRIAPRSGLAFKSGIDVLAGVIDNDYRDPIGVILINNGNNTFNVKSGDRIAQLIIERCLEADEVKESIMSVDELAIFKENGNDRIGGFGSTGK